MLALRAWRTRNSFKVPAGGLEPRQFQACGNFWRLFGNYTRGHALYTRPGFWSRGNSRFAEISGGFSETTPADKPCTPGRSAVASEIPGLRKFLAAFWKPRPRTCFVRPAVGLEPRQSLARGNSQRLFGNYTRGHALYTRPEFWSRGNPWLAEISGGFSETTPADMPCTPGRGPGAAAIPGLRKFPAAFRKLRPRTSLVRPAGAWSRGNSWLAEIPGAFLETTPANKLLSTAKRCLANHKPYLACSETMSCLQISECHVKKWSPAGSTPSQTPFFHQTIYLPVCVALSLTVLLKRKTCRPARAQPNQGTTRLRHSPTKA